MRTKWSRMILSTVLLTFTLTAPAHADSEPKQDPLTKVKQVYTYLYENHLDKPTEGKLIQAALQMVSQEVNKAKQTELTVLAEDDTYEELTERLNRWQSEQSLDWSKLSRWSVEGMVHAVSDPYTMYFTSDQLRQFEESVENEFVGFGLRFRVQEGSFFIREVISDSPADLAGIETGDVLLAADGKKLTGKKLEDVFEMLQGEEGTPAKLSIYKPKLKKLQEYELKRALLTIREVEGSRFLQEIGYIRLETFGSDAGEQFQEELGKLGQSKKPLKGLVIDLRDNSGGYLSAAKDIASLFIEDGVLMYTTNRNGIEIATWVRNGRAVTYPVRFLVNEGTASASELLAGALHDHGIAKLVGSKTYGKGVAQQIVPVQGDALKLTLHQYFTPRHQAVDKIGLTPEITGSDDIGQVIKALYSLGIRQIDLRQLSPDEVQVNGVSFFTTSPLFKQEKKGYAIRANVYASLVGKPESATNTNGYTPVTGAQKKGSQIILTYQRK